jgi:Undecaprenyl-phosphate galactose phosphotransferase WbaP
MSVITPLRAEFAQPEAARPVYWPGPRAIAAQRICMMALVLADLLAFLLALGAAMVLTWPARAHLAGLSGSLTADSLPPLRTALAANLVLLMVMLLCFASYGHYARRIPFWSELRDLAAASLLALLCCGFVQFSLQRHDSRLFLGLTWVLFAVGVLLLRRLARRILAGAGVWYLRTVVVGDGETATLAMRALRSEPALGYRIVGQVDPAELGAWPRGETAASAKAQRWVGRWSAVLRQHGAELLVLALDANNLVGRSVTESLVRERVPFAVVPRLDGLPVLGFEQTNFFSHDMVMFSYRNNLAQPIARGTKIVFDLIVAVLLLTMLAPVLLTIAALVKLDGGPVLYAHRRIGVGGREFGCLKFRSMVANADAVLHELLARDKQAAAEWAETQKLRRDPRITWIGRTLRATSLDELPQLFNVLRLEMSLVGPRPIVRAEVARYSDDITYYHEARPGLTGLWQVSGRSDTGYAQRVRLDTWYVKNWTIWHDLAILAKTVPAVLKRRGAI